MKKKRICKLLMSAGISRNGAKGAARAMRTEGLPYGIDRFVCGPYLRGYMETVLCKDEQELSRMPFERTFDLVNTYRALFFGDGEGVYIYQTAVNRICGEMEECGL